MIRKELTADTNFDEEELQLRRLELRRKSIYSQLMAVAQRTSMERRSWICLSEIADACAQVQGQPKIDRESRARVIEWLRASVLGKEFDSSREGQTRLAFLQTSPHAKLRFELAWAENVDQWKAWTEFLPASWNSWKPPQQWPVTIWMRRDDCRTWFSNHALAPPASWHLIEDLGSYKLPKDAPSGKQAARAHRALWQKYPSGRVPKMSIQKITNGLAPTLRHMRESEDITTDSVKRALALKR